MIEELARMPITDLSGRLSQLCGTPCLVIAAPMERNTVLAVHAAVSGRSGNLVVVLESSGGCPCCAYAIGRGLKRRFGRVGVFVPSMAKSAATLIALAADELVLGDLGELGPLDPQFSGRQHADFPVGRSRLEVLRALELVREHALSTFDRVVRQVAENSGMRGEDVCRIGSELSARIYDPILSQIDPLVLGETVRSLEVGAEYAKRLLRRYRPEVWTRNGPRIVERLVHGYPDHGFSIDREEMDELEIPVRAPDSDEAPIVDAMVSALQVRSPEETFVEWTEGSELDEVAEDKYLALEPAA